MLPQLIAVSSGHGKSVAGWNDPGTTGTYAGKRVTERQITVDIGKRVLSILKTKLAVPYQDILVQGVGIDTNADIVKKVKYINSVVRMNNFDPQHCYVLDLHVDSNQDVYGSGGYYQTYRHNRSQELLGYVLQSYKDYFGIPIKKGWPKKSIQSRFKGLYIDGSICTHSLLEMGHIGNPATLGMFFMQPDRVAESIAHGFLEFLRAHYNIK